MAPTTRMRKLPGDAPRAKAMEGNLIAERTIQSKSRRKRRTDGATVKKVQARLQNHENKVTIDLTVGSACDNQSTENSPRGDRRVSTIKSENTGWHNTQSNGNRTVASDLVQDGAELLGVSQPQPLVPTIDLTDDLNDDESHENSRLTAGIKSEPLNTEATDIIATTNDRGTRPFATEELMVENESEQETSAIELGPQSASCEAVIAAAGDHAEASTISLTPAPNPTSDIGLQEGPIGKAHLGEGLADIGQGTPEEVQRHLKNSLQLVQKSIKTLETELKAMDEKRKSLRQRLDERKQDAQHLTACINKSETEAKKLEKRRNKRKGAVDRHMLKTKRQRPSVPVDKTDPPACVQEPTAAASTTVTSPTTHIVLQPPGVGYHGASAHESRPLETGPDTLRGVIHDTVNPAIQSQSADVEEVENQILINSNDSQLPHGTPGLIGSRTTWEEVKQNEVHESAEGQTRKVIESYGKCQCYEKTDRRCDGDCTNEGASFLCDDKTCSIDRKECRNRWLESWPGEEDELSNYLKIRENSRFGKELIWTGPEIKKDQKKRIAEYRGQLVSTGELMHRREEQDGDSITKGHFNFEVKSLSGPEKLWLDSTYKGSAARFANHSCKPNCNVIEFLDGHGPRLFLETVERIKVGDAITIKYGRRVPPTYFRVTIGPMRHDEPVCYCDHETCQWRLSDAIRNLETWVQRAPENWSRERMAEELFPRAIVLSLRGASHTIKVHDGNCELGNEKLTLSDACGKVLPSLLQMLDPTLDKNGN